MIELQHDDVRLTAVDAWVVKEVGDQLEPVCAATLFDLLDQSCLLSLVIPVVVPAIGLSETAAAPRLSLRLAAPNRWELIERFPLAASSADPHLDT